MNFLDEVTYNIQPGEEVPSTVKSDDTVNIGDHSMEEKKGKDLDGDGDVDSDDYLAARNAAIKKAKSMKEGVAKDLEIKAMEASSLQEFLDDVYQDYPQHKSNGDIKDFLIKYYLNAGGPIDEGKAKNWLVGLGLTAAAIAGLKGLNNSDPVVKAIKTAQSQGLVDTPAEKKAAKDMLLRRGVWLDTGKGEGGDITVANVNKALKEVSITGEYEGKPVNFNLKDITNLKDILNISNSAKDFVNKVSMAVTDETSSISREDAQKLILFYKKYYATSGGSDYFRKTMNEDLRGLMAQGEKMAAFANKQSGYEGGVSSPVRGVLAAMTAAGAPDFNGDKDLKAYWTRQLTKAIKTQMGRKYMSGLNEKAKTIELPADTTFTVDLKHLMKKHMDEGKSKEDTIKFTKALMAKLHNKGEVTVDGTKIVFKEGKKKSGYMGYTEFAEADIPQDTQLALPEPDAQDFLGDDGMDYEGGMAKSQMLKMKKYAMALCDMIDDESQLESWVQAKLTKASDYMSSVYHYLDYQKSKMNELNEAEMSVNVNRKDDEVEVTYKGERYKSALGDELVFIHYFKDGEYHGENDAPKTFKYLKGKGGKLEVDEKEATLTIKMNNLKKSKMNEAIGDVIPDGEWQKLDIEWIMDEPDVNRVDYQEGPLYGTTEDGRAFESYGYYTPFEDEYTPLPDEEVKEVPLS